MGKIKVKKLKTLKDLENFKERGIMVYSPDLRAEAIKHIKEIKEHKWTLELKKDGNEKIPVDKVNTFIAETLLLVWIQYFFNLTGEDLRDG